MEPEFYSFVAAPGITAYELAQIIQAARLQISAATYGQLPVELQAFFEPIVPPVNGGTP